MENAKTVKREWPFFSRIVSQDLLDRICENATFVYIRGRRRVGKTSLARHVLESQHKTKFLYFFVKDDEAFLNAFAAKAKKEIGKDTKEHIDISELIISLIKQGYYIYFDEMQRATTLFQQHLQEAIDDISYRKLHKQVQGYGGVILSGSLPSIVDTILSGPTKPLYNRGHHTIRMKPLTFRELNGVFGYFGINDGMRRLALFSVCSGYLGLYQSFHDDGLLESTNYDELIERLFEKLQDINSKVYNATNEPKKYYENELGKSIVKIMEGINEGREKQEQQTKIKEKLQDDDSINDMLKKLEDYEIIKLSTNIFTPKAAKKNNAKKWVISDIAFLFCSRVNTSCTLKEFSKSFSDYQGFVLEEMVRCFLEERYDARLPVLPNIDEFTGRKPNVKRGEWFGFNKVEIDIVCELPTKNTIILGSCKRQSDELSPTKHWCHIQELKKQGNSEVQDLLSSNTIFAVYFSPVSLEDKEKDAIIEISRKKAVENGFHDTGHLVVSLEELWTGLHVSEEQMKQTPTPKPIANGVELQSHGSTHTWNKYHSIATTIVLASVSVYWFFKRR
jgi:predicted AAA+ superfamily ATPase